MSGFCCMLSPPLTFLAAPSTLTDQKIAKIFEFNRNFDLVKVLGPQAY
ncbi:hypothetical protein JBW_03689 [Pelosinus fermentans JBW45]|uniref:Uncharacterized protein n=1 Tax=Pelosinus fermentans JBW45 TaxID=1192197 RepID=I9NKZ7_9FIRM|nr:hypothetical protein JBW_03689 [Pelosinus fermentans JBW45]